jgi:hypothetical protein
MTGYYILAIDSFMNSFSMVDTSKEILFQYLKSDSEGGVLDNLNPRDEVLLYRRSPIGTVNILLEVTENKKLKKRVEVSDGASLKGTTLNGNPEEDDLIQIDKTTFTLLLKRMLGSEMPGENEETETRDQGPRITGGENILLYGVPGVGKSYTIQHNYCDDPDRMERVVFHPDYTYSDFVGQILPKVVDGQLKYVFTPGPFTKLLGKAWDHPDKKYYLVIEEINRGNAPAIFGEIFQLLDRKDADSHKYRPGEYGESEYGITNFEVASEVFGDESQEIRIPSNMWILATMNTADQNVFTLDTAFQRRWNMQHIKNDVMKASHAFARIEGSAIEWGAFATVINDMVAEAGTELASSEDKRLGAYFVKANELGVNKFPEKVLKYLWDDAFKMDKEAVFDEHFKVLELLIETYEQSQSDKLQAVLRAEVYRKMLETMMKENAEE